MGNKHPHLDSDWAIAAARFLGITGYVVPDLTTSFDGRNLPDVHLEELAESILANLDRTVMETGEEAQAPL